MIFGSKALTMAFLGALVFSDEASAAKLKGNRNKKGLRKAQRELKGGKGKGKDMNDVDTRADADEETVEAIIDAVIENKADAGGDAIGDEVDPDAMVPDICEIDIDFTDNMCMAKYQYTATARTRPCSEALECYGTGDTTQITFKYTADASCTDSYGNYCLAENTKAQGGRVWIVENTDMFQMKLPNAEPKTYENLKWHVQNDLDNAMPIGKTLYDQDVWVDDEFSIPINSASTYKEIAYMAFDKDGNLISFVTFDVSCPNGGDYSVGGKVGNAVISSFRSTYFMGIVTSQVYIDSYTYTVENNCEGDDPATVYSLDRTFCSSSCGEDKWECSEAEGYNPFSCVKDGKIQLGCTTLPSGSTTLPAGDGKRDFKDSIDGKGPVDLLTTKFQLKVAAMVKYPEYWIVRSTPEGGVTSPVIAASGCM